MKRPLLSVLLMMLLVCAAAPAFGSVVFHFSYTANPPTELSVSGTLFADLNLDGTFTATSGTGTATGNAVPSGFGSLTLKPNPSGTAQYWTPNGKWIIDNQIRPSDTGGFIITNNGLWFGAGPNGEEVNLWGNGSVDGYTYMDTANFMVDIRGTFLVEMVPEPATILIWSMLGAAWMGGLTIVRRRRSHGWAPEARTAIFEIIESGRK